MAQLITLWVSNWAGRAGASHEQGLLRAAQDGRTVAMMRVRDFPTVAVPLGRRLMMACGKSLAARSPRARHEYDCVRQLANWQSAPLCPGSRAVRAGGAKCHPAAHTLAVSFDTRLTRPCRPRRGTFAGTKTGHCERGEEGGGEVREALASQYCTRTRQRWQSIDSGPSR